jgi:hypothetical protein
MLGTVFCVIVKRATSNHTTLVLLCALRGSLASHNTDMVTRCGQLQQQMTALSYLASVDDFPCILMSLERTCSAWQIWCSQWKITNGQMDMVGEGVPACHKHDSNCN